MGKYSVGKFLRSLAIAGGITFLSITGCVELNRYSIHQAEIREEARVARIDGLVEGPTFDYEVFERDKLYVVTKGHAKQEGVKFDDYYEAIHALNPQLSILNNDRGPAWNGPILKTGEHIKLPDPKKLHQPTPEDIAQQKIEASQNKIRKDLESITNPMRKSYDTELGNADDYQSAFNTFQDGYRAASIALKKKVEWGDNPTMYGKEHYMALQAEALVLEAYVLRLAGAAQRTLVEFVPADNDPQQAKEVLHPLKAAGQKYRAALAIYDALPSNIEMPEQVGTMPILSERTIEKRLEEVRTWLK